MIILFAVLAVAALLGYAITYDEAQAAKPAPPSALAAHDASLMKNPSTDFGMRRLLIRPPPAKKGDL